MIDDSKTFQTIEGFGGAFTDAAATVFAKLPRKAQEAFLKACFDPVEGNAYTLCRTTIHSCDYSAEMYTYDDTPGDKDLKDFTIKHDLKDRIPFIKRAHGRGRRQGQDLRLYASPWSPPAWMKTNNDMLHGGKLKARVRPDVGRILRQVHQGLPGRGHPDVGRDGPERGPGRPGLGILHLHRRRREATSSRTTSGPRCRRPASGTSRS